ncbi:MAG: ABC transporter ATP-binding protein [Anaerolineae bacterium]|nr:ABC transporter ATP-binding protein [Anaerolineae bacterium]
MMDGFRLAYFAAVFSVAVTAAVRAGTSLLMRYFVDDVLGSGAVDARVIWVALGFVLLAVVGGGFLFLSNTFAAYTAEGVVQRLRDYLYDHVQRLTFTYHDQTPTGDLIQRTTSDADAVRRFFADQAIGLGRIMCLFLINWAVLLGLDWRLGLVSVVVIPPIVAISYWFFGRVSKAYEDFQEQEAVVSTILQENLTGVRVVKAFARQRYEMDKFDRENWEKYRRGKRLVLMHSLFWPASDILCGVQIIAGYVVAAMLAINGEITVGTYMAYATMLIWIIFPMRNLGRIIVQMSTGLVSYERVAKIIREPREPLDEGSHTPAGNVRGEVVFDDVCFAYADANTVALKDITFRVEPGQAVALLGPTGSGKSTLVNLLPRFYEYTGGSLTLDGEELNQYPRGYLRSQIGIVEQEPFLFSRSIRDNITYGVGRSVSDAEVIEAARAAAIHDVIMDVFPDGYDTLVGEKGVTLSGGQKQRVAIARTLLKDPRILILDDATSSVDTETEEAIRDALERLMEGRTTFIIAHRIQSVMKADLILVLDDGEIVQHGTHAELLREDGIYRQIYDVQARIEDELEREIAGVEYTAV